MPPLTFFLLTSLILPYVGAEAPSLRLSAESHSSVWNAVAVDADGSVYISGPRWASDDPMGVARLGPDGPQPYPNAEWNSWTISAKNLAGVFVGVNAIRTDAKGSLWVVDTGTVQFGGAPLRPGGAKLVRIDLRTDSVSRIYPLDDAVTNKSYVDDVRFSGDHAYLSDAGHPSIIVLCLKTGRARRALHDSRYTTATPGRDVIVDGSVVKGPDGNPLAVHADQLEVSPDGSLLYFSPLSGPMRYIETRYLNDPSQENLDEHVKPWFDIPPSGGTAMDVDGTFYFTVLATNSVARRLPNGTVETVISDPRLSWPDAMVIDANRTLWIPAAQLHRASAFNDGRSKIHWPVQLFTLDLNVLQ